ncbi:M14 family zinc carboxypeptidase [Agilicoccus flavus]|uniref:M14 family zinc carboxypeptidase n=1 Tax=Agilicoccus flavus TaxID=2775968 RepID=UPI001CF663AD|nr:M14 family zinc carboxypeptidase [Agilicoccus flavus]
MPSRTMKFGHARAARAAALVAAAATALAAGALADPAAASPADAADRAAADARPATAAAAPGEDAASLVTVTAPTKAARDRLARLGFDVTEHATTRTRDVVLHGRADATRLRAAGFRWQVKVADLAAQQRRFAAADRAYAKATSRSPLPSGRTAYRTYDDYVADMKKLATTYPTLVRLITLPNRTTLGRPVHGLEITTDVHRLDDGKPVYLVMGAHHAREWPSSEASMEYAFDLLANRANRAGDARARRIVAQSRTIIVPVVNVDGFIVSRSAAPKGDFSPTDHENRRKTCSISAHTPADQRGGTCADNPAGRLRGTDANRNYPGFWGGPGASADWRSDTYRGDAPGSEPEVDNIRRLVSQRQVVTLVSNHTYSNLVLRPPSILDSGLTPDEPLYRTLGGAMAEAMGYVNQRSFELYDTSGSVEDWSYWNTGGLGFTFEIGKEGFHPPFASGVVAEYVGAAPAPGADKGGIREALYRGSMSTLDARRHARIVGTAPRGHTLSIRKQFISATSPVIGTDGGVGAPRYYSDTLTSSLRSSGGRFDWAVNPSTRPLVAGRYGRDPVAPPSAPITLVNPAGVPALGKSEQATFTVAGPPAADNGKVVVEVGWTGDTGNPAVDWDVEILGPDGKPVASAGTLAQPEKATLLDPVPGTYTVRVTNFAGGASADWRGKVTFASPAPATYSGLKEAWTLTCTRDARRKVVNTMEVVVDRGGVADVGRRACRPGGR